MRSARGELTRTFPRSPWMSSEVHGSRVVIISRVEPKADVSDLAGWPRNYQEVPGASRFRTGPPEPEVTWPSDSRRVRLHPWNPGGPCVERGGS